MRRSEVVRILLQERFRLEKGREPDNLTWMYLIDGLVVLLDPERTTEGDEEE